jgi:hypothetical protein
MVCVELFEEIQLLRPIEFLQIIFTLQKLSSHKSNLDCIRNLVGKYAIYCLSYSALKIFDQKYFTPNPGRNI